MSTHRLVSLLACLALVTACKDRFYCPGKNALDECRLEGDDAGSDGDNKCRSDDDCAAPNGVCDLGGTRTCVQCTTAEPGACVGATPVCAANVCVQCTTAEPGACVGTTPVCVANACHKCTEHAQCTASNVCLPDGSCADPALDQVAYVKENGTGMMCTQMSPCGTLDEGLQRNTPYVKIEAGTVVDNQTTTIDGKAVTILADHGAKLSRTNGVILEVRNDGADVQIFDLEITGETGAGNAAISIPNGGAPKLTLTRVTISGNTGGGISATGGTLTVSQSTISGNAGIGISATGGTLTVSQNTISSNTGGGIIATNGTFVVVGNVFYLNGTEGGGTGGIRINTTQSDVNRLEFNSFNQNKTQVGAGPAIDCLAGVFTAKYNIMSGNGTQTQLNQVGGGCVHAYSIARPGVVPLGTRNSPEDPLFVNATAGDLHIQPTSPARHAADAEANLTGVAARDLDGDLRSSPADIGADQVTP